MNDRLSASQDFKNNSSALDTSTQLYKMELIKRNTSPRRPATCLLSDDFQIAELKYENLDKYTESRDNVMISEAPPNNRKSLNANMIMPVLNYAQIRDAINKRNNSPHSHFKQALMKESEREVSVITETKNFKEEKNEKIEDNLENKEKNTNVDSEKTNRQHFNRKKIVIDKKTRNIALFSNEFPRNHLEHKPLSSNNRRIFEVKTESPSSSPISNPININDKNINLPRTSSPKKQSEQNSPSKINGSIEKVSVLQNVNKFEINIQEKLQNEQSRLERTGSSRSTQSNRSNDSSNNKSTKNTLENAIKIWNNNDTIKVHKHQVTRSEEENKTSNKSDSTQYTHALRKTCLSGSQKSSLDSVLILPTLKKTNYGKESNIDAKKAEMPSFMREFLERKKQRQ